MIFETLILLRASFTFVLIPNHRQLGCEEFHLCSGDFWETSVITWKSSSLGLMIGFIWKMTNHFYLKQVTILPTEGCPEQVAGAGRSAVSTRGIRFMGKRGRTCTRDYLRLFYMLVDSDWVISPSAPQFLHLQNEDCLCVCLLYQLSVCLTRLELGFFMSQRRQWDHTIGQLAWHSHQALATDALWGAPPPPA